MLSLLSKLQLLMGLPQIHFSETTEYANIWIYTINQHNRRNCGFVWEPGGFANFLILAIIINLALNKFNLKNKKLIILLITLLTTLSTTGYLSLIIITFWYLYNVESNKKIFAAPIILLGSIYILNLDFILTKILKIFSTYNNVFLTYSALSYKTGNSYSMGRFAGFMMNIKDFLNNPVIGYGGHSELTWANRMQVNLASINGLGSWLAMFGSIGMIIFIYSYYKSFKTIGLYYNFKKHILLFFVILVLGFSFNLIQTPLFFAFMLSYIYIPLPNKKYKGKKNYE